MGCSSQKGVIKITRPLWTHCNDTPLPSLDKLTLILVQEALDTFEEFHDELVDYMKEYEWDTAHKGVLSKARGHCAHNAMTLLYLHWAIDKLSKMENERIPEAVLNTAEILAGPGIVIRNRTLKFNCHHSIASCKHLQ